MLLQQERISKHAIAFSVNIKDEDSAPSTVPEIKKRLEERAKSLRKLPTLNDI
jgi:hypothetical protein